MEKIDKITMKETRALIEFQTRNEYVEAMVEDLSDWLNYLYNPQGEWELTAANFFTRLQDGVILCRHAHIVQSLAETFLRSSTNRTRELPMKIGNQILRVPLRPPTFNVMDFSKSIFRFHARDNVSNFIGWCRDFNIPPSLTFETDDLVGMKNPRSVVVALLEVSRIGTIFGMEVPDIIQLEREIEEEINQSSDNVDGVLLPTNDNNLVAQTHESGTAVNYQHPPINIIKNNDILGEIPTEAEFPSHLDDNISTVLRCVKKCPTKTAAFGFKGRRASLNIPTNPYKGAEHGLPFKMKLMSQEAPDTMSLDTSDTESTFSQSSHSKFSLPKYKTNRPVGRVKIYDNFDQSNFVREKKNREKVDLRSLDERVREILSQCQCEELFLMKRISEGRYQWGDKKTMIFIRILRTHVMVRVGGGWNTLGEFLSKHDPCRKEKCENFKFYLPAQNRKLLSSTTDETSVFAPINPLPVTLLNIPPESMPDNMISQPSNLNDEGICSLGQITPLQEKNNESLDVSDKERRIASVKDRATNGYVDIMPLSDVNNNMSLETYDSSNRNEVTDVVIRPPVSRCRPYQSASLTTTHIPLLSAQKKTITKQSYSMDTRAPVAARHDLRKKSRIPIPKILN